MCLGNERTHFGIFVHAVTHRDFPAGLGQAREEFVGNFTLEQEAGTRTADLALTGEDAEHGEFERGVEIGIGENDVRALAAEFEGDFFQVARCGGHDFAPGDTAAGEGNFVHAVARREGRSDGITGTQHEVGRPGREAGLFDQLEKFHRRNRRHLGGFQNARIARGKTRGEFPHGHKQRVIPRNDLSADPDRFAHGHADHVRVADAVSLSLGLAGQAGVVAETTRRIGRIVVRLAQRLPVVLGVDPGEFRRMLLDEIGQGEKLLRTLGSRALAPRTMIESLACRADRVFRIGRTAVGCLGDDLVGRGIENVARCLTLRGDPPAVDVIQEGFHGTSLNRVSAVSTMLR